MLSSEKNLGVRFDCQAIAKSLYQEWMDTVCKQALLLFVQTSTGVDRTNMPLPTRD